MEITKDNYLEKEGEILKDIEKCDFISFDLEMTGINVNNRNFLDFPEERYLKYKQSAEKFRIIQLGIVTWFKSISGNKKLKFIGKPYNIYVFPSEDHGFQYMACEISSMVFNKKHGMDFNKWIKKGVNYLNTKQLNKLLNSNLESNINLFKPDVNKKIFIFKKEDQELYKELKENFNKFINDKTQDDFYFKKLPKYMLHKLLTEMNEEIRNTIYISNTTKDEKNVLLFKKIKKEEKQILINEENLLNNKKLNLLKGVKNIWDEIIKNKKIIVGHNLSYDLLYCFSHFGDDLPEDYQDFKKLANSSFRGIYDTKILYFSTCTDEESKYDSALGVMNKKLYKLYKDNIDISIYDGFTDYSKIYDNIDSEEESENAEYHQADFDAFITGSSFCYILSNFFMNKNNIEINYNKLEEYNFKVFFMKSFYKCLDFKKSEEYKSNNTIAYCLRSLTKTCDFNLEQIINNKELSNLIVSKTFIEGSNSLLIFVDLTNGNFQKLESELISKGEPYFQLYILEQYKNIIKEEENQKKLKNKKINK